MSNLQELASEGRMIPGAPIQSSHSIVVLAGAERVWKVLTDVKAWPGWHPYLKDASLSGSFQAGSKIKHGGLVKHHLVIAIAERPVLVMLYGTLMNYSAITRWDLEKTSVGETKITFTESSEGLLLSTFYSDEKLRSHLSDWLMHLKAEAERTPSTAYKPNSWNAAIR